MSQPPAGDRAQGTAGPSSLYGPRLWELAVSAARILPASVLRWPVRRGAELYRRVDRGRRRVVESNLRPIVGEAASQVGGRLFRAFGDKLVDLWRFEAGRLGADAPGDLRGREHFEAAVGSGRGVLLVTVHLGNWELGATVLNRFGRRLLVVTQAEPGDRFTERRQAARAAQGVDTVVIGENPFAFVDLIRRLGEGALVALLIDRPVASTGVRTSFFGRPFDVSRAPAELARASGCLVVPVLVVRGPGGAYMAEMLPPVEYDRRGLGSAEARAAFAGEILRAFEPAVRQHPEQWFHFVPVWPGEPSPA